MKWLAFVLFLTVMFPSALHAEMEGILSHFQPYITLQEEYDSNINLAETNKKSDFITRISPGFRFSTTPRSPVTRELRQAPTAEDKYGMDLDFNAGFNFYARNHEDNYTSLNGILNAWYALTQKLNARVRDYLIRSDDIRESDYSPTAISGQYLPSRTVKRVPWIRNVFEPTLQYQFGRENFFSIKYTNNIYNIQSRNYQDSVGNSVNPKLAYWFDIRNGLSLEYSLTFGNFERSPDVLINTANGRYTYRFNPKTSIFANYTQSWINYEKPRIDYSVYNPSIGVEHAFSSTLNGRLQVGYYWANPEKGSKAGGPYYNALLTQRAQRTTYTISFEGGYTEDFFSAENRGLTEYHRAIGRVTRQLFRKTNVGIFASYEWQKFVESAIATGGRKQINNIWGIGGNASYELFRWLMLSLEVNYTKNNTNISNADYSDYRGIFKVTVAY